jgi:hypothetical protein
MPMFPDSNGTSFAPLTANLTDMISATSRLHGELEYVIDDSQAYGVLTEDTFLENCPEILKQMERITALLRSCTQSLSYSDEMFAGDRFEAPASLAQEVFIVSITLPFPPPGPVQTITSIFMYVLTRIAPSS